MSGMVNRVLATCLVDFRSHESHKGDINLDWWKKFTETGQLEFEVSLEQSSVVCRSIFAVCNLVSCVRRVT